MRLIGDVRKSGKRPPPKMRDKEFDFRPRDLRGGWFKNNIKNLNPTCLFSTSLFFQMVVPPLLFSDHSSTVTLSGSTDIKKSPPSVYIKAFNKHILSRMGINVQYNIVKEGFHPMSDGKCEIKVQPMKEKIKPINFTG